MLITDNNTINVILWSKESIASNDNIKIKTDMELPASEYINQISVIQSLLHAVQLT